MDALANFSFKEVAKQAIESSNVLEAKTSEDPATNEEVKDPSNAKLNSIMSKRVEMMLKEETAQVMKKFDLTKEQLDEIYESFRLFDLHGRNAIHGVELQKTAQSVGRELTDEDIREIVLEVDVNETGEIDFIDFVTMLGKDIREPLQETDIQNVFNVFDQDGDGFVSPEEMHRTFLALGVDLTAQEVNQIFEKYDHDLNGLLSYEDLRPLIEEVHQEISPQKFEEEDVGSERSDEGMPSTGGGFG